jgi:polyadenylate-binding protein 2
MKAKLADMEQEAAKLQEMQARRPPAPAPPRPAPPRFAPPPAPGSLWRPRPARSAPQEKAQKEAGMDVAGGAASSDAAKEEVDSRSVYVGGVDYACTPEELQSHFQQCGTVNRVTILTDQGGNPKGYAYIEFLEVDAVEQACLLDGSELHSRALKVSPKRTNVPGMRRGGRGRGRGRGRGFGFMPMMPPPFMFGYGGYPGGYPGFAPRGRGRGRGRGGGGGYYAPY